MHMDKVKRADSSGWELVSSQNSEAMLLAEKGWGEPDLMEVGYSIVILENGNVSYCSHPLFIVPYILYYPLSVFEGVCVCVCGINWKAFIFVYGSTNYIFTLIIPGYM